MTHQREAVELLPCPFCGSDDVRFEPTYIDNDNWGCIVCKACSAEADYGSRKDATSFWNTRADGARVPLAGLEGAEDWEVGPCVDRLGHVTSWDINIKPEPDAKGVAVIASVYSGEKVARAILAAIRLAMRSQQSGGTAMSEVEKLVRRTEKLLWPSDKAVAILQCGHVRELLATITRLSEENARKDAVLKDAREAIASLPKDALGEGVYGHDLHDGAPLSYPIRDELLSGIDAALTQGESSHGAA